MPKSEELADYFDKTKGSGKESRKTCHNETKDNPYSQFVEDKNGTWKWTGKKPTKKEIKKGLEKNVRYKEAYSATVKYMSYILINIK